MNINDCNFQNIQNQTLLRVSSKILRKTTFTVQWQVSVEIPNIFTISGILLPPLTCGNIASDTEMFI